MEPFIFPWLCIVYALAGLTTNVLTKLRSVPNGQLSLEVWLSRNNLIRSAASLILLAMYITYKANTGALLSFEVCFSMGLALDAFIKNMWTGSTTPTDV